MSIDTNPRPRYIAMELAEALLADLHTDADAEERARVIGTVLCAGQHLAERGHPGEWARFDAASFLPKMPGSDWDRVGICLDLAGLFGWMGFEGLIEPDRVIDIVTELRAAGPDHPLATGMCDDTIAAFQRVAAASACC